MAQKRSGDSSFSSFLKESESPKKGKVSSSYGPTDNFQSSVVELKGSSVTNNRKLRVVHIAIGSVGTRYSSYAPLLVFDFVDTNGVFVRGYTFIKSLVRSVPEVLHLDDIVFVRGGLVEVELNVTRWASKNFSLKKVVVIKGVIQKAKEDALELVAYFDTIIKDAPADDGKVRELLDWINDVPAVGASSKKVDAEVVPLEGTTGLADDAGGCPAVGVDRWCKDRLSVATENRGVELLKTSLETPTAVGSASSIEYAADHAITERSVMLPTIAVSQIYICDESTIPSCFKTLKREKLPKLAIANGNWVGQLPADLRKMSFGTRSLMRSVQTFVRITAFTGTIGPGGSSLKGHTPVRVLVVSPFTSDAATFYKGKIASTKADYIIEPTQIKALYQFWRDIHNDVVENISFDDESFLQLPDDVVSPDVFLVEKDGIKEIVEEMHGRENTQKKTVTTAGDSLLRSVDEETDATMISSTITIGDNANTNSNGNEHQQLIEFVSDSMPKYLETLYPDLFPFGHGGFDENRKVWVSNKALVAYYANLSTRQFQQDFALPVYDYIARRASSNMARIRAYLPSRIRNQYGSVIPRAEAYGRISNEDLKKATKYDIECVKSKLFGQMQPRPPESLNGLASTFFTDQKIDNQEIQHSQAAAQKNRQDIYASHANNGKAYIWLTISPNDAKSWQVLWFTLGPAESRPHSDAIPLGSKRFTVLGNHPVAAALNFQRILDIVIKYVIGWCQSKNRPYKRGGLFGVPKAWLRVVEEQSRLTLHTHMLIWLCGHGSIEKQFDDALKLADGDLFEREFCAGEKLKIASRTKLEIMRKIGRICECQILLCEKCKRTVTITEKLMSALQLGYVRLGKHMPSDDDVDTLIWRNLREKPLVNSRDEVDLWTLDLASIHLRVNQHYWRHRKNCFKNGRNSCRYSIPPVPTEVTQIVAGFQKLSLALRRERRIFFFTDCIVHIMSVLNCNNCVKYVKDQKVRMYYGAYSTKPSADCEQALNESLRSIEKYGDKMTEQQEKAENAVADHRRQLEENGGIVDGALPMPRRSDFSVGLGKLLSGVRASTKGDTICGPLAAFVLLRKILKTNFCCDPFQRHKNKVVGDKLISLHLSDSVYAATNTLRLIPGYKICKRCFEFMDSNILKPSNQESPAKSCMDSSEPLYFNSPEVKVYTPRRIISALSNASIISPIAELDRSNSERRLRICSDVLDKVKRNVLETEDLSLFNANDYKELLDAVRVKINLSKNGSERLSLLTLATHSWTHEQTSDFFGVSKYSATQAADLKIRIGILAQAPKKRSLSDEEKARIIDFYTSDEYSRQLPGMKNVKSVKQLNGKRMKIQKRLLLVNIKELYAEYKKKRHFCKWRQGKRVNLDFFPAPPRLTKLYPDSAPIAFYQGGVGG
ncbi:Uncharacterized protein APZ42_031547 [Daphnia magna]|uniref:Uncharacterized protein n=1 Tax=Daphnia magna TaxID=35525 RepID=A0A164MS03_9CRUS|nr:Uncharacterized protein APZ42_031547 [Daphnia magna]